MSTNETAEISELVNWLKEQADSQEGGPSSNLNKAAGIITSLRTRLEVAEGELAQLRSSIRDTMESLGDENDVMTGDLYTDFVTFQGESDVRTMNSALVDILHIAIGWEIDAPERDQIEKIAINAIPTTAQIMIAFNSEQALKAQNERLVRALGRAIEALENCDRHVGLLGGERAKLEEAKALLKEVKP